MKKVVLEFFGQNGDEAADEFYTYLVDGGLEDHLIQFFEDRKINFNMADIDNAQRKVLVEATPLKP